MKMGTATLDRDELRNAVRADPRPLDGAAVGRAADARGAARPRRRSCARAGCAVSFANGHFDLLHVGHLRYLRGAKARGDVLVVAINGDDSVARLKGPGRPIVPAAERAELLAALEPVDFVVIFEERHAGAAARARCSPTCTARAPTTARPSGCPSTRWCSAYGGETALVGDPKDHATRRPDRHDPGAAFGASSRDRASDLPMRILLDPHQRARRHRPLPAGAAARCAAHFPEAHLGWVVEDVFAPLAGPRPGPRRRARRSGCGAGAARRFARRRCARCGRASARAAPRSGPTSCST